jgi:hypothetical protein
MLVQALHRQALTIVGNQVSSMESEGLNSMFAIYPGGDILPQQYP